MHVKSVLLFLLVLFLYSTYLEFNPPYPYLSQSQSRDNLSKIEKFQLLKKIPSLVIVGSSSSNLLISDIISSSGFNLSIPGFNSITGLKILEKENIMPDTILVEALSLNRKEMYDIHDEVYGGIKGSLKGYFKFFQEDYRPMNFVGYYTIRFFEKIVYSSLERERAHFLLNYSKKNIDDKIIKQVSVKDLGENLDDFFNYLKRIKENGRKVILFETPLSESVKKSNRAFSEKLRDEAKKRGFNFIKDYSEELFFTDGVHLDKESAIKFSHYLRSELVN